MNTHTHTHTHTHTEREREREKDTQRERQTHTHLLEERTMSFNNLLIFIIAEVFLFRLVEF